MIASAHVVSMGPHWVLKVSGQEVSRHYARAAACEAGRDYLQDHGGGELIVHSVDGQIIAEDTLLVEGTSWGTDSV